MKLIIVTALFCFIGWAQSPVSPALPMNVQVLTVPAATSATNLSLSVDASPNGGDFIDVVSPNPQIQVSLILPGGVVVTPANASSLGFTVVQRPLSFTTKLRRGKMFCAKLCTGGQK